MAREVTANPDDLGNAVASERTPLLKTNATEERAVYEGISSDSEQQRSNTSCCDYSESSTSPSAMLSGDEDEATEDEEPSGGKSSNPYLCGVTVLQFWLIYAGVLGNSFVSMFDSTLMASTHPVITSYFQASNSASWLSVSFLLTSTSFQPLFGRLSDTIGRKKPYVLSLAIFLFGTICCAAANSVGFFIFGRAVCGLGAGGMMSLSSIIASDLVPIEIRGAYQSYVHIAFGTGSALGAATGGIIADHLGWRWEFAIQVPILAVLFLIACFTTPSDLGVDADITNDGVWAALGTFDYKGSILGSCSITFLIIGLVSAVVKDLWLIRALIRHQNLGGNVYDWHHPVIIAAFLIFGFCTPIFIYVEKNASRPIIPIEIVTCNPRAGLLMANFLGSVITYLIIFNAPLYFQAVRLESATTSGLRLLLPNMCTSVIGTATGFIITYTQKLKWSLTLGTSLLLAGSIGLAFMRRDFPDWTYSLFLASPSMGQGFQNPGTFMSILTVSLQKEQAVVSSTLILFRSIGMVFGIASSTLVIQNALIYYLDRLVTADNKKEVLISQPPEHSLFNLLIPYRLSYKCGSR